MIKNCLDLAVIARGAEPALDPSAVRRRHLHPGDGIERTGRPNRQPGHHRRHADLHGVAANHRHRRVRPYLSGRQRRHLHPPLHHSASAIHQYASSSATDSSRRLEVEEVGRAGAAAGGGGADEVAGERVREAGEGVREVVAARPGAVRRRRLRWREEAGSSCWLGRELPPRGRGGGELRDSCLLMHRAAGSDDVREVPGLVVLVALHPLQEVVTHG